MEMKAANTYLILAAFLVVIVLVFLIFTLPRITKKTDIPAKAPDSPSGWAFDGDAQSLKASEVVPTLNTCVVENKNVIWCASFLAAWKMLEQNLTKGAVLLEESPPAAKLLNEAVDPKESIPVSDFYQAVGWRQNGILNQIRNEVQARFPGKQSPSFPDASADSFIVYSYLQSAIRFPLSYDQNKEPLSFTDSVGRREQVDSFGIPKEDAYTCKALRLQPVILFAEDPTNNGFDSSGYTFREFAIDLAPTSAAMEVVLAVVPFHTNLASTLSYVEDAVKASRIDGKRFIGVDDVLLIPDVSCVITSHFSQLENKQFLNKRLFKQPLSVAREDISFRLDKEGAVIQAESKEYTTPIPRRFIYNQPFLLYMKKRSARIPYFVMWVANSELLNRWN